MPTRPPKKPLYRKVNTRARGVRHDGGGDYRDARGRGGASGRRSMGATRRRGLDDTPLFRFLLSKVGEPWDGVFSEAVARLDRPDPVFWLVALDPADRREVVRVGPATYFSGLTVDDDGVLRRVNPDLGPGDLTPACSCCTHTLDGVRFG